MPAVACVLGCRSGSAALARRARAAAALFREGRADLVVASGGRAWDGVVEADAIADLLRAEGVPEEAIVRERCSLDTRDNARFTAALLGRRGRDDVLVVSCSWHVPRSIRLFERAGLRVVGSERVPSPDATLRRRIYWWGREAVTTLRDRNRKVSIG